MCNPCKDKTLEVMAAMARESAMSELPVAEQLVTSTAAAAAAFAHTEAGEPMRAEAIEAEVRLAAIQRKARDWVPPCPLCRRPGLLFYKR